LGTVPSGSLQELGQRADKLPWSDFLQPGQPVKVRATVRGGKIKRRDAVEERIARCARHSVKGRGAPNNRWPQEFVVRVMGRETTISADAAGLLHKRGYRQATAKAPLRENLAAALLLAADWHPEEPLLDPFCGSGTFAIEAAWMARDIPPGRKLRPALAGWPSAPKGLWDDLVANATAEDTHPAWIRASDRDEGALRAARGNAARAGVAKDIQLACCDLRSLAPPEVEPGLVICNLPWGKRIGDPKKIRNLYSTFGAALRERLPGWRLAVLCPDRALAGRLVPRMEERLRFENGGLKVGFYCGVIPSR
jgi:putative N6-adenine-specific DNA methylase